MYPSLEQIKQIASQGDYRRIPVCMEMLSDSYTPVEVMKILRKASRHCYLLESASQSEVWGRYSFLGYDPGMEITCLDDILTIRETMPDGVEQKTIKKIDHPGDVLREILDRYKTPQMEDMPSFTGGLVGYFSYDYIKYSEPKLKPLMKSRVKEGENQDFRDMDLMLFDKVIAFDHYRQKLLLITGVMTEDIETSYEAAKDTLKEMADLIRNGEKEVFKPLELKTEITPHFSEKQYCEMVEKAKEYIREGDIFQVVLSNPMRAEAEGSLFDTYRVLRTENPSPYMFYFSSDDIELSGASPETLAKLENGKISTFPLAGTRPRGKDDEEDKALEAELLKDEKELAEHNMLVDLGRNDIGKVSEIGSVKVEEYLSIERFSHVMHIGSTVTGKIRADKDAVDAVDAILPAGTLSGAPKFRACQIIEELENDKRGVYGGAIGYLDFTGNMDTCIAIRLVYKKNGRICIRSGAGVVADSVPENEFRECINKAKAVVTAIGMAKEGI
ncbi:Anthranilate synthase component 1 [uncultured Eubacterium sp.]|uniref:anthranilate synthase component I n=1 Tax=Brotomerdimonas butyrica TaxID=2981721 RepID=UPI00082271F8|nr:anthranilate synthase component I [Brotomerdimonas butyrica]MCU6755259.1 anthranilate synthase component I [Brotomerdimonas butyrica]SCH20311.1 Anthranilate synthase component 1 [uncultured Eubacterium sp.]